MKKAIYTFLIVFLPSICWGQLFESSKDALTLLNVSQGAKATALGEAFSSISDDSSASYWNPAGLGGIKQAMVGLSYNKWFMESSLQNVGFVMPFKFGTVGVNASYVGYGNFVLRNEWGIKEGGSVSASALGGALAFGKSFGVISAGLALKGYQDSLPDYSVTGFGADLGLLGRKKGFSVAAGIRNIGKAGDYNLPQNYYGGTAYQLDLKGNHLLFCVDGRFNHTGETLFCQGLEFGYRKTVFLRFGSRWNSDDDYVKGNDHFSGGFGINLKSIMLDYAISPYGELGTTHKVSLGYVFGTEKKMVSIKPKVSTEPAKLEGTEELDKAMSAPLTGVVNEGVEEAPPLPPDMMTPVSAQGVIGK